MRTKIILHGSFRDACPISEFECEADTPIQAVRALTSQIKIVNPSFNAQWELCVVDCDTIAALYSPLTMPELHLVPSFAGAGGVGKIIVGAVLVVAAIVIYAAGWWTGVGAIVGTMLLSMGLSLIMGGILELMTPAPKKQPNGPDPSNYLGSPMNTTAVGTPIPIGYGRYLVYGQYLSVGLEADPAPVNGQAPTGSGRNLIDAIASLKAGG